MREAEADEIASLVTTTAGLGGHATVDYVTGWTNGDPTVVRGTAARVVTAAAQIIDALHLDDTPATDSQATGEFEEVGA